MGVEILPQFAGRPSVLVRNGWTEFVCIRDANYLRTLKAFKRLLRDNHPDKGGKASKFRKIMGERLRWQNIEANWYAELGLLPPDGYRQAGVKLERVLRLRGVK